jgi:hypothetical protein
VPGKDRRPHKVIALEEIEPLHGHSEFELLVGST